MTADDYLTKLTELVRTTAPGADNEPTHRVGDVLAFNTGGGKRRGVVTATKRDATVFAKNGDITFNCGPWVYTFQIPLVNAKHQVHAYDVAAGIRDDAVDWPAGGARGKLGGHGYDGDALDDLSCPKCRADLAPVRAGPNAAGVIPFSLVTCPGCGGQIVVRGDPAA